MENPFKSLRTTAAALVTLIGLGGAMPAFAQNTAPAGVVDAVAQKAADDPCTRLESQALRMMQRCDQPQAMPVLLEAAAVRSTANAAADFDFTALRAPAGAANAWSDMQGMALQPGESALLAVPARATVPFLQADDEDTIVVIGSRIPQDDYMPNIYTKHLEAEFGNQPSGYEQFEEALASPVGRIVSSAFVVLGMDSLSRRAGDAAADEVRDGLAELIVGGAESGAEYSLDPRRASERQWMEDMSRSFRGDYRGPSN